MGTSFVWWGEGTRQGTWCLFVLSGSCDQHFIGVSAEEEDNVFCGSVVPLCLMRGNIFFEELQKFCLLVYNLNTVCVVLFVHFLDEIPPSIFGYLYRSLCALCSLGHGSFPCSLLWQNMICRTSRIFILPFPAIALAYCAKMRKKPFHQVLRDRNVTIAPWQVLPFTHSTLKANCLRKKMCLDKWRYRKVEERSQDITWPVEDSGYFKVSLEQVSYMALSRPAR